jgi:hypothetical protein
MLLKLVPILQRTSFLVKPLKRIYNLGEGFCPKMNKGQGLAE